MRTNSHSHRALKVFLTLCLAFTLVPVVNPQPASAVWTDAGWLGVTLRCVTFIDSNVGFVAGDSGVIIKTENGGVRWRVVRSGGTERITGITFADSTTGWAVAQSGVVYGTTDGGDTWSKISDGLAASYSGPNIYDTIFAGVNRLFAVGGALGTQPAVWDSGNGSYSWGQAALLGSYDPSGDYTSPWPRDGLGAFYGIDQFDGTVWVVGQDWLKTPTRSVVWRNNSGSPNWTEQQLKTSTGVFETVPYYDISFSSATNGVAVGGTGKVHTTTTGGTTWTPRTSGVTVDLKGVSIAPGTSSGWAVGASNTLLRTTNGGANWTAQASGVSPAPAWEDVYAISATKAVAVGSSGRVVYTTDGGTTWTQPAQFPAAPVMTTLTSSSHPSGTWVKSTALSAAWSATGEPPLGYGWELDTSPATVPTVQKTTGTTLSTTAPGSGTYYLHVAAKDQWNRWSAPLHRQVLVDVTVPTAIDDVYAGGYVFSARVTVSASDAHSGVKRVEYRVNSGSIVQVSGAQAIIDLGAGDHQLEYRAVDNVDNVSSWVSKSVNVENPTPPEMTSLTSSTHPAGAWTASTDIGASWSATGVAPLGYGWVVDMSPGTVPGVQNTSATTLSTTVAGSGTYYLHVAVRDVYGRWSAPMHRQLLVDVTVPEVADDVFEGDYEARARITLSASDAHSGVQRIEYRIDGGSVVQVAASQAVVDIDGVGEYEITYRAIDNAGNASGWMTADVSVVPPAGPEMTSLTSSSHPVGTWTASTSVSAAWSATGDAPLAYGWVLDTSAGTVPSATNTSNTTLSTTVAGSGTYYLHVRARDSYEQWSATSHRQLLVDVTLPQSVDDVLSGGYTTSAKVTVSASDTHSGVQRIEYRIDGGDIVQVTASQTSIDFGVGEHALSHRAVDNAGNVSGWTNRAVTVSPPAPPVMTELGSSSHAQGTWTSSLNVSAAWSASGTGITGYGYVLDTSPGTAPGVQNTTGTTLSTSVAGSGTYYLHVAAKDAYDQWSVPWHRQLLVDVTAPAAADDVFADGYVISAHVTLTATDAHSGVQRIEYRIDGGSVVQVTGAQAGIDFGIGERLLEYRVVDNAGNVSAWTPKTVSVSPPPRPVMTQVSSSTHPEGAWATSTSLSATWSASGTGIDGYGWIVDQSPDTVPVTANTTGTSMSQSLAGSGVYYLHVAARDAYGQWSLPWHQQILVDNTAPEPSDDISPDPYPGAAQVTISASDAHSGVARIEYRINGGAVQQVAAAQAAVDIVPATQSISYRAVDRAGNASSWVTKQITVELPVVPVEGKDRYATAIAAADIVYPGIMPSGPDGNRTVVLASGENWPDALAASGLAGAHRAPLLLTKSTSLPTTVAQKIASLGANRVIIVGGTAAVSDAVATAAGQAVGGASRVSRIAGSHRYATANAIAAATVAVPGRTAWDGTAFVATGDNFPDALAVAPLAADKGYPLYLAAPTGISDATLAAMKAAGVKRVYLLGGTAAVSPLTESRIAGTGISVAGRWAGSDRFATGRVIAENSLNSGLTAREVALATGRNFPDALAGGVMQGLTGSIMVLTESTRLHAQAEAVLAANVSSIHEIRFVGGLSALAQDVRDRAEEVVAP